MHSSPSTKDAHSLASSDRAKQKEDFESAAFLKHVLNQLPISVTVQDESGRFLLANSAAADCLQTSAEQIVGAQPADFMEAQEAQQRRDWERDLLQSKGAVILEDEVQTDSGIRTYSASYQASRFGDTPLLITSALDVSPYKAKEQALASRFWTDELTGLPNRKRIQDIVETAVQIDDGTLNLALAFVDLDNFKYVNDYYSHSIGDALLVKVAERISGRLGNSGILARISGDEFVLAINMQGRDRLADLMSAISHDLRRPFHIEGFEIFSSCSIGVSIYPEHGRSYETLRRSADSAMYRAKHHEKGGVVFFDSDMAKTATARMEAEQRLRLAVEDRKFCCAFQPKVDIHTQKVVGFETLARWIDDSGGIHPPSEFIAVANETGLIDQITWHVIDEAASSLERLDREFGSETSIAINLAARQANNSSFMQEIASRLKDTQLAHRFILELTEEAFISGSDFQQTILPRLRNLGVRVSIDDFGVGYSSLASLADLTADEVKIDRSFIESIHTRPRSQTVLRAIESLCRTLGMSIVAEGVENSDELAYLMGATRIRCVQGFYFARPFFIEDLQTAAPAINRPALQPRALFVGPRPELVRAR